MFFVPHVKSKKSAGAHLEMSHEYEFFFPPLLHSHTGFSGRLSVNVQWNVPVNVRETLTNRLALTDVSVGIVRSEPGSDEDLQR